MKIISKAYPEDDFPYKKTYEIILNYKVDTLKNGLMESHLNKLEIYIRDLCKKKDPENKGLISISDLIL